MLRAWTEWRKERSEGRRGEWEERREEQTEELGRTERRLGRKNAAKSGQKSKERYGEEDERSEEQEGNPKGGVQFAGARKEERHPPKPICWTQPAGENTFVSQSCGIPYLLKQERLQLASQLSCAASFGALKYNRDKRRKVARPPSFEQLNIPNSDRFREKSNPTVTPGMNPSCWSSSYPTDSLYHLVPLCWRY